MTERMRDGEEARTALREWVLRSNPGLAPEDLDDDTPLIESHFLTSLQAADLLVFIERWRMAPVSVESLTPASFRDIDSLYRTFFDPTTPGG